MRFVLISYTIIKSKEILEMGNSVWETWKKNSKKLMKVRLDERYLKMIISFRDFIEFVGYQVE